MSLARAKESKELPLEEGGAVSRNPSSDNLDKSDDGYIVGLHLDCRKFVTGASRPSPDRSASLS
jgi:hypothetical protein